MSILRIVAGACCLVLFLAGCAKPPQRIPQEAKIADTVPVNSYVPVRAAPRLSATYSDLSGRVMHVGVRDDIQLRKGEVILTFDDGPSPKNTGRILDVLDRYDVRATFLSVGRMAKAHPETLQEVSLRGHTIGTHTHDHEDLAHETHSDAMHKIEAGYRAVAKALEPIGARPAPFFRFPYLSSTKLLRATLAEENFVVLDVEIDSGDYRKSTPDEVLNRTLRRLDKLGRGIILFHDIHARTAKMLPDFLEELSARGYEVVHIVPDRRGIFGRALVVAGLSDDQD